MVCGMSCYYYIYRATPSFLMLLVGNLLICRQQDVILYCSSPEAEVQLLYVEDVRYWTFQNKYQDRKLGTLLESAQKPSRGQKHSDQLGHNRSLLIQLVWQHVLNTLSSSSWLLVASLLLPTSVINVVASLAYTVFMIVCIFSLFQPTYLLKKIYIGKRFRIKYYETHFHG